MKKFLKVLIGIIFVIVVALFLASPIIGSRIKSKVEAQGSEMAQAEIKLGDIDVCITCGRATMKNVFIGNPKGFKAESAFKLGEANVVVDTKSILSDVLVIKEIKILQPEITYEIGLLGSNVGKIQRNIEEYIGYTGTTPEGVEGGEGKEVKKSGKEQKVIIEHLIIEEAKVRLGAYAGDKGDDYDITIPQIHLKDIGKEEGGIDKAQAGNEILTAVNKELIKHGGAKGVVEKVKGWFN